MARRITSESVLMERVVKMLPKNVPARAIKSVECDPWDGANGGGSYWVYLNDGWICNCMGCHTIHEDTLAELKVMVQDISSWPADPDLVNHRGYTRY